MKWSGAVLTVLLLVVWVGSGWWHFSLKCNEGGGICNLEAGQLVVLWLHPTEEWSGLPAARLERRSGDFNWGFFGRRLPIVRRGLVLYVVGVPIWSLALAAVVPSAWLWYRDRRRAPGLCNKCGYDLRGNASGVCPECGSPPPCGEAPTELKVES